jgi:Zn-dependent M28 family amino/carboxypeptidase
VGLAVREHGYELSCDGGGVAWNLSVELGRGDAPWLVIGAHYDTVPTTPGADDNASGVSALIELGALLREPVLDGRVRLVALAQEEPPFFMSADHGAQVEVARSRKAGEQLTGMVALESIGCFSTAPGSQRYPLAPLAWHFGTQGDYISFVSFPGSFGFLRRCVGAFRESVSFPSVGLAAPFPDIGRSDNLCYAKAGYPALMVTDTADFRNPNYHTGNDLPATLDYDGLARVTEGLAGMARTVAGQAAREQPRTFA